MINNNTQTNEPNSPIITTKDKAISLEQINDLIDFAKEISNNKLIMNGLANLAQANKTTFNYIGEIFTALGVVSSFTTPLLVSYIPAIRGNKWLNIILTGLPTVLSFIASKMSEAKKNESEINEIKLKSAAKKETTKYINDEYTPSINWLKKQIENFLKDKNYVSSIESDLNKFLSTQSIENNIAYIYIDPLKENDQNLNPKNKNYVNELEFILKHDGKIIYNGNNAKNLLSKLNIPDSQITEVKFNDLKSQYIGFEQIILKPEIATKNIENFLNDNIENVKKLFSTRIATEKAISKTDANINDIQKISANSAKVR